MIRVKCLERDKSSGLCQPVTIYVNRLSDGAIQDAQTGYQYERFVSTDTILGWGELDGNHHVLLDGPCHEYLVPEGRL